jgi:hypothetical protein
MKKIGMFLIGISIVCLIYFTFIMDTSVKVNYKEGNNMGLPERVNNIGLMNDKQNFIIVSGVLLITGVLLSLYGKNEDTENQNDPKNS